MFVTDLNAIPVVEAPISGWFPLWAAVAVGQQEEPGAPMRSADFSCREQTRLDAVAHSL